MFGTWSLGHVSHTLNSLSRGCREKDYIGDYYTLLRLDYGSCVKLRVRGS